MADADVIAAAGSAFDQSLLELTTFMQMCRDLEGDGMNPWVFTVGQMVGRLDRAGQAYIEAVTKGALPHLRDLAAINRPRGGMGAMAPMVTKVDAGELATSRK